jgi:hypothetical protein
MTTETRLNPLAQMAANRRKTLKLLARAANLSHRWATAAAGAAIAHTVAAGHALVQARDLCEEGGWLRWLRKNFEGSIRRAQRSMSVARHLPASGSDATRVSPRSQAAVLRAIRGVVFTGSAAAAEGAPRLAGPPSECDDDPTERRRVAFSAARRLRKLAGSLLATTAGARATELIERISALATDLLLDVGICAGTSGEVAPAAGEFSHRRRVVSPDARRTGADSSLDRRRAGVVVAPSARWPGLVK